MSTGQPSFPFDTKHWKGWRFNAAKGATSLRPSREVCLHVGPTLSSPHRLRLAFPSLSQLFQPWWKCAVGLVKEWRI